MPAVVINLIIVFAAITSSLCSASSSHGGASVQLFEWSWSDVATECETFLGPKGYKSVQVSPPNEHITGTPWWTRYQPVTYNIISRSGTEAQFIDMVKRCTAVNVDIIVDAVINHMAAGSGTGVGGSKYGSRQYPYYSPNDFHHDANNVYTNCAVNNYNDKYNVQYCDLSGLPDLLTSSSYVQSQIVAYLKKLYSYGVKGIRIDAAKHQDATELGGIVKQLPSDFYVGQEVIGATGEAVQPSMYYSLGQVSEFYYADYLDTNVINQNKMIYLQSFGESWGLMPDKYAVAFLDNHDTQRNGRAQLTYKSPALYTMANMFMLAWPYGNVRVMSSYYFTNTDAGPPSVGVQNGKYCMDGVNWVCEHRWVAISNMVAWRNAAGTSDVAYWQTGSANQIAFSRNSAAFVAFNRDEYSSWTTTLSTGLPAGTYCNVIVSASCGYSHGGNDTMAATGGSVTVTVGSDGKATLTVPTLSAVAIHINAKAN